MSNPKVAGPPALALLPHCLLLSPPVPALGSLSVCVAV